jgi:hypothetical protein
MNTTTSCPNYADLRMPTGIEEAAATALAKKGLATVGNSAIRWLSLGPRERLFRLLFVEFGDSVAMAKDEFYAFGTDEGLCSLTDDLLAGRRPADDATASLIAERIETRLHRVPEADRHAMASEIGTFAVFSYTAALKTPEEIGHNIAAKVDLYGTQTTAALTDIQAELKRLVAVGDKETDLVAALMSSPLEHQVKRRRLRKPRSSLQTESTQRRPLDSLRWQTAWTLPGLSA